MTTINIYEGERQNKDIDERTRCNARRDDYYECDERTTSTDNRGFIKIVVGFLLFIILMLLITSPFVTHKTTENAVTHYATVVSTVSTPTIEPYSAPVVNGVCSNHNVGCTCSNGVHVVYGCL
jgi:hypothetical protein